MNWKTEVTVVVTLLAIFGWGCEEDVNLNLQRCKDYCAKTYEECGEEYIENLAEIGVTVTEDELPGLLEECETQCEEAQENEETQTEYDNCVINTFEGECRGLANTYLQKSRVYNECVLDCQLELGCEDFFDDDDELCEPDCQTESDAMTQAAGEFVMSCPDGWDDAFAECAYILSDD